MGASDFLKWSLPSFQCPKGIDKRVCDYTQFYVDESFRAGFYCSKKYEGSGPKCDKDPACSNQGEVCGTSPDHVLKSTLEAVKVS